MQNVDCKGCSDSVKRAILYSKNPNSICNNCRTSVASIESKENSLSAGFPWYPLFNKNQKKRSQNTFAKVKRYASLLSKQIGSRFSGTAVRAARQEYQLVEKLCELYSKSSQRTRENMVKVIRTCCVRDYNLEQINDYLRPKGTPFEEVATYFQDLYDNYINRN